MIFLGLCWQKDIFSMPALTNCTWLWCRICKQSLKTRPNCDDVTSLWCTSSPVSQQRFLLIDQYRVSWCLYTQLVRADIFITVMVKKKKLFRSLGLLRDTVKSSQGWLWAVTQGRTNQDTKICSALVKQHLKVFVSCCQVTSISPFS